MRRLITFHRWLGLLTALLVIVPAVTALVMNHRPTEEKRASDSPFDQYVLCTSVDPRGPSGLWVGASEGLFRSRDGGATFAPVTLPVPARQVNTVAFDRRGAIYVALRYSGVYRSSDDGASWTQVMTPAEVEVAGLSVSPDGAITIATPRGMYDIDAKGAATLHPRPPAPASSERAWLRLVYDLHDGRFWGRWGVWITDAASVAIVVLALTGVVLFFGIRRGRRGPGQEAADRTSRAQAASSADNGGSGARV